MPMRTALMTQAMISVWLRVCCEILQATQARSNASIQRDSTSLTIAKRAAVRYHEGVLPLEPHVCASMSRARASSTQAVCLRLINLLNAVLHYVSCALRSYTSSRFAASAVSHVETPSTGRFVAIAKVLKPLCHRQTELCSTCTTIRVKTKKQPCTLSAC